MRTRNGGVVARAGFGRSIGDAVLSLVLFGIVFVAAERGLNVLAERSIQTVRVKGSFRYIDPILVQGTVREKLTKNYFTANLDDIKTAVAAIPWVADVQVERRWPDRIEVSVLEHRPVARWGEQEFVDDHLNRFYIGSTEGFEHLPLLAGPSGQEQRLVKALYGLNERFKAWGATVAELKLTDRWSWSMRLATDVRIECGRQEPLEAVSNLLRLLPLLGKERMALLQSVDLRYPYGFAVVWKPQVLEGDDPPEQPAPAHPA